MANTARKGNAAELFVAKYLEGEGFVVASRRHVGGAGDLLAVHPDGRVWLVEVKHRKNPYEGFRRADRQAMFDLELPEHAERWLANRKGQKIEWTLSTHWP